eukprot:sb/3471069/
MYIVSLHHHIYIPLRMFSPRKCGIKYDPPTLILEYIVTATGKLHRRSMPLRDVTGSTDPDLAARKWKSHPKHGKYLEKLDEEKLSRVLGKCIRYLRGAEAIGGGTRGKPTRLVLDDDDLLGGSDNMDLNKLNDSELQFEKSKMQRGFLDRQIKPGDSEFEYNKEVDFGSGNLDNVEGCEWDESEENSDFSF